MKNRVYNTVLFAFEFRESSDFALFSNFLYKVQNHIELTSEEVKNIKYRYDYVTEKRSDREWVSAIVHNIDSFEMIRQPEGIQNLSDKFQVFFSLIIDEKDLLEIVEIQKLVLIKKYFSMLKIYTVMQGDSRFYYTISQYLFTVNSNDEQFYNEIYFWGNKLKRFQLNNIKFSRSFLPLQIVDTKTVERLFQNSVNTLGLEYLKKLTGFCGDSRNGEPIDDVYVANDIFGGAIKLMRENLSCFTPMAKRALFDLIKEMNVFTLNVFAYSIRGIRETTGGEQISLDNMRGTVAKLQQYSNACQQLMENIVFHSETGVGCFSLRLHKKKEGYLEEKYCLDVNTEQGIFFEIIISDYAAINKTGNIAVNFFNHIEDVKLKKYFSNLTPFDFFNKAFNGTDKIHDAWREYYKNPDHIGKHFGLNIFHTIVSQNQGYFIAESHSDHIGKEGENYCSFRNKDNNGICLPGTEYYILLPLVNLQKMMMKKDISADKDQSLEAEIINYINYCAIEEHLTLSPAVYSGQREKNDYIRGLAEEIKNTLSKIDENADAVYFSMKGLFENEAELFTKALIIAVYLYGKSPCIVLYDCERQFWRQFLIAMQIFYCADHRIEDMFYGSDFQIAAYSIDYEEFVFIPSSSSRTNCVNAYIKRVKCLGTNNEALIGDGTDIDVEKGKNDFIPYDILLELDNDGQKLTLFERYTKSILQESIQSENFGCKIEHTHMRLGSTIHISEFYEAEILFGNKLFIGRFAYLIVKDMLKGDSDFTGSAEQPPIKALTLYGYGTYSETLLVEIAKLLGKLYPEMEIDYIILEREEEHRGLLHADRIRYGKLFKDRGDRVQYFKNRKIVVIVPINSTLKTHSRLISMFESENDISQYNKNWIAYNYAILLVGSKKENPYWSLDREARKIESDILPIPRYFIEVQTEYNEALGCKLCFPVNSVAEMPLIEVNAASTIPNQALGMIEELEEPVGEIPYEWIKSEEDKISPLKDCLLYGHIKRKENHFQYYFRTDYLYLSKKDDIKSSLEKWVGNYMIPADEYHIIVSPMHFSNAGFLELVNEVVFKGTAIIVRADFDKEYRSNMSAKYANIRNYVKQLGGSNQLVKVKVHFVDDSIITGRTFYRAKSLIETILGIYENEYPNVDIYIFDKVFVMVDRNSSMSRMQYVKGMNSDKKNPGYLNTDYYTYIHLNISSLRTYGDSCVVCNLKKESDLLYQTASTKIISDYWKKCNEKFRLDSLEYVLEEKKEKEVYCHEDHYNGRAYRRLVCTHISKTALSERNHGNQMDRAMLIFLRLINHDYESREKDGFEFLLSYLKVTSRPFIVFNKAVKEAVFDVLLIIIEILVYHTEAANVILQMKRDKPYLLKYEIKKELEDLDRNILKDASLSEENKKDIVLLIMKQLTELKSNYIIRLKNMNQIFKYVFSLDIMKQSEKERESFQRRYLILIKKLVGISSDTSKSVWLDYAIREKKELERNERIECQDIPEEFIEWIALENTRVFRDGIEKLYRKVETSEEFLNVLKNYLEDSFEKDADKNVLLKLQEFKKRGLNQASDKDIEKFLYETLNDNGMFTRKSVKSMKKTKDDMQEIFKTICRKMEENLKMEEETEKYMRMKEEIKQEINRYQYNNFYKFLHNYDFIKDGEWTEKGVASIAGCLGIYKICKETTDSLDKVKNNEIIQQIQKLAILINNVFHSFKVQMLMEKVNKADLWKENIKEEYKESIVDKYYIAENEENRKNACLNLQINKEYMLLAGSMSGLNGTEEIDDKAISRLNSFSGNKWQCQRGFVINKKDAYLIWEVGRRAGHLVFLYAELPQVEDEFVMYNHIRNVMMSYYLLENSVFSNVRSNYLHELVIARRELEVFNRDKAHSHTKNDVIQSQYALAIENASDREAYYRSYVLTLLADLNVSEIYRNSLKPEFYNQKIDLDYRINWGDQESVIQVREFYVTYGITSKETRVRIETEELILDEDCRIQADERVVCSSDSKRQFFLLMLSLILNAAGKGRGKEEDGVIKVYLSKTPDGLLRILNEAQSFDMDMDKIRRELLKEPETEERGISLWGMSRYIKRFLCRISNEQMEKLQMKGKSGNLSNEAIKRCKSTLELLLGDQFELKVDQFEKDGKIYFWIGIPVLWEKYTNIWDMC